MANLPGSAGLVLVDGVRHLDEPAAVFEAMLTGWENQQKSRMLAVTTIGPRIALVRRFNDFAESYPWAWTASDVDDFTASLTSASGGRLAHSTIRAYHVIVRLFCEYLIDPHYDWVRQCRDRFGQIPSQVCHEWNTAAHLTDYEGKPDRRPFTYDEVQQLFDHLDQRVDTIAASGRKGALAALRDAQMIKTAYAYGLRCNELCRLDVADLRTNPHMPEWGIYGSLHVRFGKATRGSVPQRRTVLTVPEFDWVVPGLEQWVDQVRPILRSGDHPALWLTERLTRVTVDFLERRFVQARTRAGLPEELTMHCLRHAYVTHLVEFGYPERFVQEQVGHRFASTTAIYTSVSNDFKKQTLRKALKRVYAEQPAPATPKEYS